MRVLSLIIVGICLVAVVAGWFHGRGGDDTTGQIFPVRQIIVTGTGNTLATVAAQVQDPRKFNYDPVSRRAVSHATLVIEGELQLGREGDPESGEILELATELCGDLKIRVPSGGAFRMYHSKLRTVGQIMTPGACSRGYSMFVDGSLTMVDSHVSYISGSRSESLRRNAEAVIRRSTFSYCDGNALKLVDVDGGRIVVDDSDFQGRGNWGVVVQGSSGAPVQIRNCVLEGQIGAVFVTGEAAHVQLLDCVLGKGGIVFHGNSGKVEVASTRRVKVVDARGAPPKPGVLVRAASGPRSAVPFKTKAKTDDRGVAELVVTDWVARPGAASRLEDRNTVGPLALSLDARDRVVDTGVQLMPQSGDTVELVLP